MKTTILATITTSLCLMASPAALAQFNSGSTGVDGALNVTTNTTLDLPPNGIFNFTTINVASGATLTFNRNVFNTPVYLLATGDVVIAGDISVNAVGRLGGPGGFDGGFAAFANFPAGDGQGPGGGKANISGGQYGVFAFGVQNSTNLYGNTLLSPLIGGSGGAGSGPVPGGGGGGAILVASN